jgi:hypothetical protein
VREATLGFRSLEDYSSLTDLHVYGDLLTLYSYRLPNFTSIAEAGRLYNEFSLFERRLLTLYVSYVLAGAGFYDSVFASDDFAEVAEKRLYTTKFSDNDWIEIFDGLPPGEGDILGELNLEPWDWEYENEEGEKLGVVFVEMLLEMCDAESGRSYSPAEVLVRHIGENKDLSQNKRIIIAHPLLSRKEKESFRKTKAELQKLLGEDVFLSTGEFLVRFIPDEKKRAVVEENWKSLRSKLFTSFQSEYPFLAYAINYSRISWAEENLRGARLKCSEGRFDDAIKDAANACEGLLQVLCSKYGVKAEEDAQFYDLQCVLRDFILEDFGENTYNDLDLIREWRNKVVHPSAVKPDDCTTLQVITRAELFFELFKRRILLSMRRRS